MNDVRSSLAVCTLALVLPLVLALAAAATASAQPFTGIFLGSEAGRAGQEVYTVESSDSHRVTIADLHGNVYVGHAETQSLVTLDEGGSLVAGDADSFVLNLAEGEPVTLTRVFGSDPEFPMSSAPGPFQPNVALAGQWDIVELSLDPVTGEVLPQFDGSREFIDVFDLGVEANGLRFTDSLGTYFQFTMRLGDEAIGR
ncbi:MAG: hypothetical protein AAGA23_08360, partial [Pseudomonadota bacterium]